ncbi:Pyrrolo-quinoline quinone (plasmid) [Halorubrum lacusprofundi ATCC 49239]|uniref:Pyrrolo-quinoline quinone n=2 Tax=Halorubrum lacusprofundi TaxID=2247 RepID=B9LWT1_HALLT|nr:Pyrrolo-quinoline quinone [Halorubrum lacusprofundi ATCC 49239]
MLQGSDDDSNTDAPSLYRTKYDWCVPGDLEVDSVVGDTVLGRRDITERRSETREAIALSAETGSITWSYETERDVDHFTAVTVDDGIYLTRGGPQDGNGVVALNMDGTKRWIVNTAVGYERPRVANDTVYVADSRVYAFDVASGDLRWEYNLQGSRLSPTIVDVTDTVVVETGYTVLGLDPTAGTVRWEFETGDQVIGEVQLSDGISYVMTSDRIAASSDGAEQWRTEFDTTTAQTGESIVGTTSDRVFVFTSGDDGDAHQLQAFEVATGERSWTSEPIQPIVQPDFEWTPRTTVYGDIAYLGGETLRAIDATTGDELWQASVGDGPIKTLTVINNGAEADHTVFVQGGETQLATFTPDGEQTWSHSVNAPDRVSAIGEYVFVGTDNEICSLNRLEKS